MKPINVKRAGRVDAAINAFYEGFDDEIDVPETSLLDLLTNLRHWCDREGLNINTALDMSLIHYNEEQT